MGGATRLLWVRIPAAAARISRPLGAFVSDGQYLAAYTGIATVVPVVAFVAGGVGGVVQSDLVFTVLLAWVILMFALGSLGGGVGFYAVIGYIVGSLPLTPTHFASVIHLHPMMPLDWLGIAMSWVLLALLVVVVPGAGGGLRRLTAAAIPGGDNVVAQVLIGALVMAGLMFLWCLAEPVMVRPIYTLGGNLPNTEPVQSVQQDGLQLLVIEAALLGAVRAGLESLARRRPGYVAVLTEFQARTTHSLSDILPWPVRVLARGILTGVLLLGLLNSLPELLVGVGGAIVLLGIGAALVPSLPFVAPLRRVPLIGRLALGVLIALGLGWLLITPLLTNPDVGLWPVLGSSLISLAVILIAVPEISISIRAGSRQAATR